jgi:hypothetical protein
VLLLAAIERAGIIFMPDWLPGPAMRDGRLVPSKTRIFVDEIAQSLKEGWNPKAA